MDKYTLYLDASGDPGWPLPWGKSSNKLYVLGGVILTPQQESIARTNMKSLIDKHFPSASKPPELKYTWIAEGRPRPFDTLAPLQRKKLADDVFDLLLFLKPTLMCTVVDKEKMKQRYGGNAYYPKNYAFISTISRFSMTLKRGDNIGEVIMDDEQAYRDTQLKEKIAEKRRDGAIIRGHQYDPRYSEHFEPIINSLLFSKSEESPGIQLADFVAKTAWYHFAYNKSDRFTQIKHLFDRSAQGRVFEPCVIPQ
jgi:hypothetical protein